MARLVVEYQSQFVFEQPWLSDTLVKGALWAQPVIPKLLPKKKVYCLCLNIKRRCTGEGEVAV